MEKVEYVVKKKMVEGDHMEMFDSYKKHMKSLIEDNSAMNRNFYVVIPETSDISIQIKLIEDRLHSLNLKTLRMRNNGLKRIFTKIFAVFT